MSTGDRDEDFRCKTTSLQSNSMHLIVDVFWEEVSVSEICIACVA